MATDYTEGYADGLYAALALIKDAVEEAMKPTSDSPKDIAIPEPYDPLGYTRGEVSTLIRKHRPGESYDSFLTWMRGQTVAIGHDETDRYYPADVKHFLNEGPTAVGVD